MPSATVARSDALVSAPLGEELAMMDVDSGSYYLLDDIGTFIWEALAAPILVSDVLAQVRAEYDVTPERCEADVLGLLESLHDKGLLRIGG